MPSLEDVFMGLKVKASDVIAMMPSTIRGNYSLPLASKKVLSLGFDDIPLSSCLCDLSVCLFATCYFLFASLPVLC